MVPTDSQMTSTDGSTIQAMSSYTFTAVLKGGAAGPGGVTALQPSASALNAIHRRTLRISSPAVTRGILGQLQLPDKGAGPDYLRRVAEGATWPPRAEPKLKKTRRGQPVSSPSGR